MDSIGTLQMPHDEALNVEKQITLAPDKIQEMINGTFTNNGFLLKTEAELNDRFNFKSSDVSSASASQRPKLVIQYTLSPYTSTPSLTPTPSSTPTPTFTNTPSPTATGPTNTPTNTFTPTVTNTPTATQTPTFTSTPTITPTPTTPIFSNATFTYDADGSRVKSVLTTNAGVTTTYFVGNYYEVVNGVVTKYYFAGATRIAMRKNGTLTYILADHLGSTSLVTDANGAVINQTKYKAWGETRYTSGTEQTKYQYTGQYSYVSDFGLHFYNARWYDSSLGRFAQADTIVPRGSQGLDRYAAMNNNPIKYTDPSGHDAVIGFTSSGWDYFNSVLRNDKLFKAQEVAAEVQLHGTVIGSAIGAGIGFLIPGCAASFLCVVGTTVVGGYAGHAISEMSPQQQFADDLETIINLIDTWVQKIKLDDSYDGMELAIMLIDGQDENGHYYQVWIDGEWIDVSYEVYSTLEEVLKDPIVEDKGDSSITDFDDGMERQPNSRPIREYQDV